MKKAEVDITLKDMQLSVERILWNLSKLESGFEQPDEFTKVEELRATVNSMELKMDEVKQVYDRRKE